MLAGFSGGRRNGAVALGDNGKLVGACAQERVTRVRAGGPATDELPGEALDLLLQRLGRQRSDIGRWVQANSGPEPDEGAGFERIGHHFAHACTAYLSSPFSSAAIVVADHEAPRVSIWLGNGATIRSVEWPWHGAGFADVFSRVAASLMFNGLDQRFEALARLCPDGRDDRVTALLTLQDAAVVVDPGFEAAVQQRMAGDQDPGSLSRAKLAAALQARLGELLLELLTEVRRRVDVDYLCVGGSFFYHSSINTLTKRAGLFKEVFVPVDPGNSGLAIGAALHALGAPPAPVSAFLGPSYSPHETKETLDNCKLTYSWEAEDDVIAIAVKALQQGRLVGWFDGKMEWGPRALGARSILASPIGPYVLDNLNKFLKHRERWRGYALSGLQEAVADHFEGPVSAPFMECDFRPRDRARLRPVLPSEESSVRVHTVAGDASPRFRRLLAAFGEATGLPFLVNTSFNGFHEPLVCNPRDAVRVFYGSGIDLLILDQFVVGK